MALQQEQSLPVFRMVYTHVINFETSRAMAKSFGIYWIFVGVGSQSIQLCTQNPNLERYPGLLTGTAPKPYIDL